MRKTVIFKGVEFSKYEADEKGNIYRQGSTTPLKPWDDLRGYLVVALMTDRGERVKAKVHLIMAHTYIGPQPFNCIVEHKNLNKHDNSIVNLEYITQRENVARAQVNVKGKRYLNKDEVDSIRYELANGKSFRELAEANEVPPWVIRDIAIGKTYTFRNIVPTEEREN